MTCLEGTTIHEWIGENCRAYILYLCAVYDRNMGEENRDRVHLPCKCAGSVYERIQRDLTQAEMPTSLQIQSDNLPIVAQ